MSCKLEMPGQDRPASIFMLRSASKSTTMRGVESLHFVIAVTVCAWIVLTSFWTRQIPNAHIVVNQ